MSKQVLKQVSPLTSVWVDEEDKKQTSIEWLVEQLKPAITLQEKHINEFLQQAKAMHKEEVELFGALCCSKAVHKNLWSLDKLYNDTFGGQDK